MPKAMATKRTTTAKRGPKKAKTTAAETKKQKENEVEQPMEEDDNENAATTPTLNKSRDGQRTVAQGPMATILLRIQQSETFHDRYVKEMKQLYCKMDHDAFMYTFIKMLKTVLQAEETNPFGHTGLTFCAKFVTSFELEKTHPVLAETFGFLLSTISNSPHIRYRICFSVNLILKHLGPHAALDDSQCDQILHYMLDRLKDLSPSVRKQAVLAMQRLQMPDNPNDPVLCAYQYHLSSDPAALVRECVITCMGRNYLTVPYIMQRLWDVDDKVRRHTFIHMCNYPVRSYQVSQRLTLLERGLNDSSESVRKHFIKYTLMSWVETYQRNYVQLIAAIKLDSSDEEIARFRRVARQVLMILFKREKNDELLAQLPLAEDCDLHRCVPQENLTVELVLYWQCLANYFQDTLADEFEAVLPELSVFCDYVKKFCNFQKPEMDRFGQMEFQCTLTSLVEMLASYDLGDEIGRANLKELITYLLKECLLDHKIIRILVRCVEQLISDMSDRMQFFIDIIYEICELNAKQNDLVHDRSLLDKLLGDVLDTSLVTNINSLKVRILELEEQEENFVRQKEYIRAQAVNDEKITVTEQYTELIQPLLEKHDVVDLPTMPKLSKQERVLKSLQIVFYMVASEHVSALTPSICKLYKDFICRHLASTELDIFNWAVKCGTTFSLFYEAYTKEVFYVLVEQLYKDNNLRMWETSTQCIFELLDHYGVEYFNNQSTASAGQASSKSKRRLLYTMQDFYDGEEERNSSQGSDAEVIGLMAVFVERIDDKGILLAIVRGLCRLILRGQLDNRNDVLEKLLKRYFNPNTEAIVSQVLGMFFEKMVEKNLQKLLQPCVLPVLWSFMNCNYDSPLHDVLPNHVIKFFIDMTANDQQRNDIHNELALSFLQYIQNYYTERKEMCRLLAKELTTLKLNIVNNAALKDDLHELADSLLNNELEPRMVKCITDFKGLLNGSFQPPAPPRDGNDSDAEAIDSLSVAATTVSAAESTTVAAAAAVPPTPIETPAEAEPETTADATQVQSSATPTPTPTATSTQPVLTTFGKMNEVGLRFLRRSLHNSISHSDAESVCGPQSPAPDSEAGEEQLSEVSQISRRNLRRPATKARLEQALARSSLTPTKQTEEEQEQEVQVEAVEDLQSSRGSVNETETAAATNSADNPEEEEEEVVINVTAEEINVTADVTKTPVTEKSHNASEEVIEDSPTTATNETAANRTNLRSMRPRHVNGLKLQSPTGSGRKKKKNAVLHLEIQTPVRNGRKRVLLKSTRAPAMATPSQSSDSASGQQSSSPARKQQRLDTTTRTRNSRRRSGNSSRMDATSKNTAKTTTSATNSSHSPTESSASSVKENSKPTTKAVAKSTPQPKRLSKVTQSISSSTSTSTPLQTVLTRHSARKQRINSICMTRKRLSQEFGLAEGNLKMSTPKRLRSDRVAGVANTSASSRTRSASKATGATAAVATTSHKKSSKGTPATDANTSGRRRGRRRNPNLNLSKS